MSKNMASSSSLMMVAMTLLIVGVAVAEDRSARALAYDMYEGCLRDYSTACVRPKALAWLSRVFDDDEIVITEDMSVVRTSGGVVESSRAFNKDDRFSVVDRIEAFLATHALKVRVPEELASGSAGQYVPRTLLRGLPDELSLPLAEGKEVEGRGFVKKVMLPFLLGLKFKSSVLVPLALALIALKTWKALTLGLISLVLSGAMVIFKFTKPKVVNYEVVHVAGHDPHLDHLPAPGWDVKHGPYYRSFNGPQEMAYNAYL